MVRQNQVERNSESDANCANVEQTRAFDLKEKDEIRRSLLCTRAHLEEMFTRAQDYSTC